MTQLHDSLRHRTALQVLASARAAVLRAAERGAQRGACAAQLRQGVRSGRDELKGLCLTIY